MPTCRLIPSLLMREGRLVKGTRYGDHRAAGRPDTTARAHDAQGADEVALSDIDASREAREPDYAVIGAVARELSVPLTVGGGVTSVEIARRCMGEGADKVCLTHVALRHPNLIDTLAHRFGAQAVVLGVDVTGAAGGWQVYDHVARAALPARSLPAWLSEAISRGAGEIRLMSVDREGGRSGMDLALLEYVRRLVSVPIVFEGGAGTLEDIACAFKAGADAIAVGAMLTFSDNNLVKIKRYLAQKGLDVRLE